MASLAGVDCYDWRREYATVLVFSWLRSPLGLTYLSKIRLFMFNNIWLILRFCTIPTCTVHTGIYFCLKQPVVLSFPFPQITFYSLPTQIIIFQLWVEYDFSRQDIFPFMAKVVKFISIFNCFDIVLLFFLFVWPLTSLSVRVPFQIIICLILIQLTLSYKSKRIFVMCLMNAQ